MKKENLENLIKKSLGQEHKMPVSFKAELRAKLDAEIAAAKHIDESHEVHAAAEESEINHRGMIAELKEFFWGNSLRSFALLGSGGLIAVIIFVAVLAPRFLNIDIFNPETKPAELKVNATALSENGIGLDSSFVLASDENISLRELRKNISISPEIAFEVTSENGEFKLVPEEKLSEDTTYEVTLAKGTRIGGNKLEEDVTWIFRTEPKFAVVGFTPADDASANIPLNTAIEVEFNYTDIDIESFKEHFFVSPAIQIASYELIGKKVVMIPSAPLTPGVNYDLLVDREVARTNGDKLNQVFGSSFYIEPTATTGNNQVPFVQFVSLSGTGIDILPESKKVIVSISEENGSYSKMLVNVYKFKPETYEQGVFELAKHPYFKVPAKYLELVSSFEQQAIPQENIITYAEAEPNTLYYFEIRYEQLLRGAYFSYSTELGHILDTTNETIISYYGADGQFLNGKATLFFIDSDGSYQSKDVDITGLTKLGKNKIETVLGGVFSSDGKNLPVIGSFGRHEGSDDYDSFNISSDQKGIYSDHLLYYFKYDKTVYKNGDEVNFKATFRSSKDFVTFTDYDIDGAEYEVYVSGDLVYQDRLNDTNAEFSYLQGKFTLPAHFDNNVGSMARINILQAGQLIATSTFHILAYTRPETAVTIEVDNSQLYLPTEAINIKIKATDVAGNPLTGRVAHLLISDGQASRPLWADELPVSIYGYVGDNPIFERNLTLSSAGEASIVFNAPVPGFDQDVETLMISATVDNISATEKRVFVRKGDVSLLAKTDNYSYVPGQNIPITFKTVDLETLGPVAKVKANAKLERTWYERVLIGEYYNPTTKTYEKQYSSEEHNELVWEQAITTDAAGNASATVKFDGAGSYKLISTLTDSKGRSVTHSADLFYISSSDVNNSEYGYIDLSTDKTSYKAGDTLIARVKFSPKYVENQDAAIILFKDKSYETKTFKVDAENKEFEFKVSTDMTTEARLMVVTTDKLSDFKEIYTTANPEIYAGLRQVLSRVTSFLVERPEMKLEVALTTEKDLYKPGEQAVYKVKVTDSDGEPVRDANLTARAFDKALLQLSHNDQEYSNDLFASIYGNYSPRYQQYAFPTTMRDASGDGGGGGPESIRSDFREVAIFSTDLVTDKNGEAEVSINLPDNITTWVLDVEAMTADLHVGAAVSELRVSKDVIVSYHLPAGLHQGDRIELPIYIYNYSSAAVAGSLKAEVTEGLTIAEFDPAVNVAAGASGSKNIVLTVADSAPSKARLLIKLSNVEGQLLDGIEQKIQIYTHGTPISTTDRFTFSPNNPTATFELAGNPAESSVRIALSTSLTQLALVPASETVSSVPEMQASLLHNLAIYEHYEQHAEEIAISKANLRDQIELSLQAILKLQAANGGFSWFGYDAVDLETSATLGHTFGVAKRNGIIVDTVSQSKLTDYLALVVIDVNGEPNAVTSIEDKALAVWGLSSLGDSRALAYAGAIKQPTVESKSPLAVSLLGDAYLLLGSSGDARDLALLLSSLVTEQDSYAYFSDTLTTYKILSHEHFVTTKALSLIHSTRVNPGLESKLTNWVYSNWTLTTHSLQQSQIFETLLALDEGAGEDLENVELKVNGKSVFTGPLDAAGLGVILTNLQTGANQIELSGSTANVYATVSTSTLASTQPVAGSDFKVTTEFIPLRTGKASNTLPVGQFVRVRVTVVPQTDTAQFTAKAYLPTGMRAINWMPGTDGVYYDWYQQIAGQKNVSTYGQYLNDYVVFSGWQGKRGQASVFEVLLVADSKGTFSTNGTLVYHSGIAEISGYEAGKTLEIK